MANESLDYRLRQTSGGFLLDVLRRRAEAADAGPDARLRYELGCDVYIKQWSYAVLNKVFFWLALIASCAVLVWPAVLVSLEPAKSLSLVASAMTQAMATAVAGFFIGLYLHYKSRQTSTETLLRAIVFSDLTTPRLADLVAEELSRVDQGMRFRAKAEEKADD